MYVHTHIYNNLHTYTNVHIYIHINEKDSSFCSPCSCTGPIWQARKSTFGVSRHANGKWLSSAAYGTSLCPPRHDLGCPQPKTAKRPDLSLYPSWRMKANMDLSTCGIHNIYIYIFTYLYIYLYI